MLSVVVHAAVVLLLVRVGLETASKRGNPLTKMFDQKAGGGGGGGTGGSEFIAIAKPPPPPPPPPEPVVTPPVVVPKVVPEVEPKPDLKPPAEIPPIDSTPPGPPGSMAGTGGGSGGGAGTGSGTGTGSGVGPGSGGGTGGGTGGGGKRGVPPTNRSLILPPIDGVPKSLRGKSVEVTFHIDADGRVSDIDVIPPIEDRKFASKFDETMRGYDFHPARNPDGLAVPGITIVTVTFPKG